MRQKCLLQKFEKRLQLKSTVYCINAGVKHRLQRLLCDSSGPSSRAFRRATKPNGSPSRRQNTHTERQHTRGLPVCLAERSARVYSGWERWEEKKKTSTSNRRQKGWMEGKAAHSKLGLIYFINQDYKFNLQTRGQKFSLTRGPWRTAGLGDHSYY